MSEINGNKGFNVNADVNIKKASAPKSSLNNMPKLDVEKQQQTDAADPVLASLGKSAVKVDNHEMDMQRLLQNPQLAEMSDKMFNAAIRAGYDYADAATFATQDF